MVTNDKPITKSVVKVKPIIKLNFLCPKNGRYDICQPENSKISKDYQLFLKYTKRRCASVFAKRFGPVSMLVL